MKNLLKNIFFKILSFLVYIFIITFGYKSNASQKRNCNWNKEKYKIIVYYESQDNEIQTKKCNIDKRLYILNKRGNQVLFNEKCKIIGGYWYDELCLLDKEKTKEEKEIDCKIEISKEAQIDHIYPYSLIRKEKTDEDNNNCYLFLEENNLMILSAKNNRDKNDWYIGKDCKENCYYYNNNYDKKDNYFNEMIKKDYILDFYKDKTIEFCKRNGLKCNDVN